MGQQDEIVPHVHMLNLYKLAENAKFKLDLKIPDGTHNDTWLKGDNDYWSKFKEFLEHPKMCQEIKKSDKAEEEERED